MSSTAVPGTAGPVDGPNTVACPDCNGAAAVISRFALPGADGPVEYLRVRCTGPLTLLIPVTEARSPR